MKLAQRNLAFLFGAVFLVVVLVLALAFPHPTPFQYLVFRVVLSLAAAGVAAVIPGFLNIQVATGLKAGGALAVFAVVYYFNPAALVVPPPPPGVKAAASVDCAEDKRGSCAIWISVENEGPASLEIGAFRYQVVEFRDLGGTLGSTYVPDELGDLDLSGQTAPTAKGRWAYVHPRSAMSLGPKESKTVAYRATAKNLGTKFGLWTLQAQLHTSAADVDLGQLQLMLPYWQWTLLREPAAK
jgi:hypothetical protein